MRKGPGKAYRKGMSLQQLFNNIPDEAAAERYFMVTRWPDGPHCPFCGSDNLQTGAKHKTMAYRCREKHCAKRFSLKTGTVMEGSKLGFRGWIIGMYLFTTNIKGVSSMRLSRELDITQKSAWFMAHRLREAYKEWGMPFMGPAEADETFVGGKRANMHSKKRKKLKGTGPAGGKTVVAGIKDRATNQVRATVVEQRDAQTLQTFIEDHVHHEATVYTDEHPAYKRMPYFEHESITHSAGEYTKGRAHTQGIESFWATFKRAHKGTYHKEPQAPGPLHHRVRGPPQQAPLGHGRPDEINGCRDGGAAVTLPRLDSVGSLRYSLAATRRKMLPPAMFIIAGRATACIHLQLCLTSFAATS